MEEYYVEYTDEKFLTILVGVFLLMLVGLILLVGEFTSLRVGILPLLIATGAPFLVYAHYKPKVNKQFTAYVDDTSVVLDFGDRKENVDFHLLKSYQVDETNSITLLLNFSNNHKIRITASRGFTDLTSMRLFCDAVEQKIILFNKNHSSQIVRIDSIFEKRWMLWLLILGTAIFVGILINSFTKDKLFTLSFYSSIAFLIGIWLSYFRARQKERLHAIRINGGF